MLYFLFIFLLGSFASHAAITRREIDEEAVMRIIQNSFGEVRNVRISDLKTVPSTREPHTHTDDKKHTHRRRKRSDKLKLRML